MGEGRRPGLGAGLPVVPTRYQLLITEPIAGVDIAKHRCGLPMLTMDDRYLVGPLPGVAGAWSWEPAGDKPPPY